MGRPITTSEVLLQQISDSLVEIAGLLRPAEPDPTPEPEGSATVPVDGMGEQTTAPAKKTTRKWAVKKFSNKPVAPVDGD